MNIREEGDKVGMDSCGSRLLEAIVHLFQTFSVLLSFVVVGG